MRESRTVERNADTSGEDRVDEPPRIPDHHEPVAADLSHGIAVITLILERTDALSLAECRACPGGALAGEPSDRLRMKKTRSKHVLGSRYGTFPLVRMFLAMNEPRDKGASDDCE